MSTALTITTTPLINSATHRQAYITVLTPSTPAQATNTIIYDPTTTPWTTSGAYVGTRVRGIKITSSMQGASGTNPSCYLTFDASTPVILCSIPNSGQFTYQSALQNNLFETLTNYAGSGISGKIGITTNGLVAGDTITIILDIVNG